MNGNIDRTTSLPSNLTPQSVQTEDENTSVSSPVAEVAAASVSFSEQEVSSAFGRGFSELGVLGLRFPDNVGDSEAVFLLLDLVSKRLANDNDGLKAFADGVAARDALSQLQGNYQQLADLQAQSDDLNGQLETVKADKAAVDATLPGLSQDVADKQQIVDDLQEDPDVSTDPAKIQALADANADLATSQSALSEAQTLSSDLATQVSGLEDAIASTDAAIVEAQAFGTALLLALSRQVLDAFNVDGDAKEFTDDVITEELQYEVLPNLQRIYEDDLQDAGVQDELAEAAVDDRLEDVRQPLLLLLAVTSQIAGVIPKELEASKLNLDMETQGSNKTARRMLSL